MTESAGTKGAASPPAKSMLVTRSRLALLLDATALGPSARMVGGGDASATRRPSTRLAVGDVGTSCESSPWTMALHAAVLAGPARCACRAGKRAGGRRQRMGEGQEGGRAHWARAAHGVHSNCTRCGAACAIAAGLLTIPLLLVWPCDVGDAYSRFMFRAVRERLCSRCVQGSLASQAAGTPDWLTCHRAAAKPTS